MDQDEWMAVRFEENRPHLRSVAYRMLGSASEADDAVQESWLRLSRAGTDGVENLHGCGCIAPTPATSGTWAGG